jgi:hypothetical protein
MGYSEPFKLKILAKLSSGKHTKNQFIKRFPFAPTIINEGIKKHEHKGHINASIVLRICSFRLKTGLYIITLFAKRQLKGLRFRKG